MKAMVSGKQDRQPLQHSRFTLQCQDHTCGKEKASGWERRVKKRETCEEGRVKMGEMCEEGCVKRG